MSTLKTKLKVTKGYITITILILMLVLVGITYLYADALFSELAIARNNKGSQIALSLAEAGVQESIYRVQYDTAPGGARDVLLGDANSTQFTHNSPALLNNGSYTVTIQNDAKGVATITSIGTFTMGLRQAKREIVQEIAQGTQDNYPYDGAIYSSAGSQSTGDLEFKHATITVYGGSIISGKSLSITDESNLKVENKVQYDISPSSNLKLEDSIVNCQCYIDNDPDPLNPPPLCSSSPGCTISQVVAGEMPEVDFDKTPNSYKSQAFTAGHLFADQKAFDDYFFPSGTNSASVDGVVYVEGSLEIAKDRSFTINGVLASSGTISVGKSNQNGTLNMTKPGENQPSGVLAQHGFIVEKQGIFCPTSASCNGLVYAGEKSDFLSSTSVVEFTGALLTRRNYVNGRTMVIHFSDPVVEDTLNDPTDTPVIEINHWEEEY